MMGLMIPAPSLARECESLFGVMAPVQVALKSGEELSVELQSELFRLSEAKSRDKEIGFPALTEFFQNMALDEVRVFTFASAAQLVELSITHLRTGTWLISSNSPTAPSGRKEGLGGAWALGAEKIEFLPLYLSIHMQGIRDYFRNHFSVDREEYVQPILAWVKASGETPFSGDLVELFLASRDESFFLDRGFVKASPTSLTELKK
jgi:hypothetical protein